MCAKLFGIVKPNIAVNVPIKISGIIVKENIGKKIKLPIRLNNGNLPKCIAINGAVKTVATTDVKTAAYIILKNLFVGILGFTHVKNHTNPNTAEKDNWNPACIT